MQARPAGPSRWVAGLRWAVLVTVVSSCSLGSRGPGPAVVLVGDSLAEETAPYLRPLLIGTTLIQRTYGGTAPCDWLDTDLAASRRRIVVISFSGNALTPCMDDGHGGHVEGQVLVNRYQTDLTVLVSEVRATGAAVLLVGQPPRGAGATGGTAPDVDAINRIFEDLAKAEGVTYVDAGAALEGPDGAFAARLPCRPGEAECDADGTNAVRNDDGVHLCPGSTGGPCAVYSSGADRFATAIADAAIEVLATR